MSDKGKEILLRRGFDHGAIPAETPPEITEDAAKSAWSQGKPLLIKQHCRQAISKNSLEIEQSNELYLAILDEQECDELLAASPYHERLNKDFEALGSVVNQGEDQEIETVCFDAVAGDRYVASDLWMKVSWLSFHQEDASMRFRFSFGVDHEEDVAADKTRQFHAARLTNAVFPESRIITEDPALNLKLEAILECDQVQFVERIVYFNAPGGGAYLHHDRERGHAGVVYAQLSGSTFWLALSKRELMNQILSFVGQSNTNRSWPANIGNEMQSHLGEICAEQELLSQALESFSDSTLIHLINETASFTKQLIDNGHGYRLIAGDVLLLPQETDLDCCWHSVFCIGGTTGEALSFAIRSN
jgi:hypothetical protein